MKTQKSTKRRVFKLMMAFAMLGGTAMAQTRADFSGKWLLDIANSTNLAKDNAKVMAVSQDSAALTIHMTGMDSVNMIKIPVDTVYLDGAAHPYKRNKARDFKLPQGKVSGFSRITTPAWSADGKSLTISTTYSISIDDKPLIFKTTEKWTLDSTGQKLTISGNTSYPDNTQTYTDIYTQM